MLNLNQALRFYTQFIIRSRKPANLVISTKNIDVYGNLHNFPKLESIRLIFLKGTFFNNAENGTTLEICEQISKVLIFSQFYIVSKLTIN